MPKRGEQGLVALARGAQAAGLNALHLCPIEFAVEVGRTDNRPEIFLAGLYRVIAGKRVEIFRRLRRSGFHQDRLAPI
jgi:hypothetical protein